MNAILWFRLDLRLADNPALQAAAKHGGAVIPVFIWAPDEESPWEPGGASRWWLHHSLLSLQTSLKEAGARLIIRRGETLPTLRKLAKETNANAVFWNRRYEPAVIARDKTIKETLRAEGIHAESFNAALLNEPWTIANQSGKPFQVFTPFWKHCLAKTESPKPLPAPKELPAPPQWPATLALKELQLEPKLNWASGFPKVWHPGEPGAVAQLNSFLKNGISNYPTDRDRPDHAGTSRLSPHLHFGEISPRQIWHSIEEAAAKSGHGAAAVREGRYLAEIGWREFSHHLLFHFPKTPLHPLRPDFDKFPWHSDKKSLQAWQRGNTGYPIVDAGMRELWATGWMHNRVRMIVASFLVKDLLIPWTDGARWFWDTLVDADLAQNTLGWQWSAGCGADAAPYFRIFNPITQGEKFDPRGDYVRRWCPELTNVPDNWLHQPWRAPSDILAKARVILGKDYPEPLVNHTIAREVALEAFARIKSNKS
jgi:deoxyribodipyrimidine photo-lyase